MICSSLGSGGMHEPTIIASVGYCSSIQVTATQPTFFLWPANGTWLVQPGQSDCGCAKGLIVPKANHI